MGTARIDARTLGGFSLMIDYRFSKLPVLGVLYDARKLRDLSDFPDLPDLSSCIGFFPHRIWEMDAVIDVLNEIERAHVEEMKTHPTIGTSGVRAGEFRAVRAREFWRVGSYVMFASTLEDIIRKRYEMLLDLLGAWRAELRAEQQTRHSQALADRRSEMSPIVAVRNKVFAHTAWAKPLKEDSAEVQHASLSYFASGSAGYTADGMHFGGYYLGEDGKDSCRLPRMSMKWLIDHYPPHAAAWHGMYVDVCELLKTIPDEVIKAWAPAVHTVIGRPLDASSATETRGA